MKNDTIKRVIFAILTLICMVTITSFSFQNYNDSNKLTVKIMDKVLTATNQYEATDQFYKDIEAAQKGNTMRALAHISLFFVLGFCLVGAISKKINVKSMIITFVICVAYAFFDELLQKYLGGGRTFEWTDLFEDWGGSFGGIAIHYIIFTLVNKKKIASN